MIMNFFSSFRTKFLQNLYPSGADANNGDSSIAAIRGSPSQTEVPAFSGERWEDIKSWLETIHIGRTASDALAIAKASLAGQARIAFATKTEAVENWKQFREWALKEFEQSAKKRGLEFFAYLSHSGNVTLANFIASAIELGLEAKLNEREMTLAINARLPTKLREDPKFENVVDLKTLSEFTKDLTSRGKLQWSETRPPSRNDIKKSVVKRSAIVCNFCQKKGHKEAVCRSKKSSSTKNSSVLCVSDAIKVDGTVNGTRARMLVDTGARDLYISENLADRVNVTPGEQLNVTVADGRKVLAYRARHEAEIKFANTAQRTRPTIVPGLAEEVILGRKPLAKAKVIIDTRRGELTTPRPLKVRDQKVSKFSGGADIEAISGTPTATEALPNTLEDSKPILEKIRSKDEFDIGRTSV
ncbi:MAG: uncharacterized protein A8A55_2956, partial [Amphiamblys sp. WSBS2006]